MNLNNLKRISVTKPKGGGSGGGDKFTSDFTVALTSGKTLGKYLNGQTVPANGKTAREVILDIAIEYLPPAFTSFLMSGQNTVIEVGDTVTSPKTFTWGTSNSANVEPNTIAIRDVTNNILLASGLANDGTETVAFVDVTKTIATQHQWRAEGINTQSNPFNSANFTVNWRWRVYSGNSFVTAPPTPSFPSSLANQELKENRQGTYSLAATGYKYFIWPDSFGSPPAGTGFKDAATNLAVSMADGSDNSFFSNVQNGWYYGLITVTNAFGVSESYRVYRTKNTLSGSINIIVT